MVGFFVKSDGGIFLIQFLYYGYLMPQYEGVIRLIELTSSPIYNVVSASLLHDYCRLLHTYNVTLALGSEIPTVPPITSEACIKLDHGPRVPPLRERLGMGQECNQ